MCTHANVRPSHLLVALAIATSFVSAQPAGTANVLTQHYNNARTGATLDEKILTTRNVGPSTFGKLWTLFADGQVVAQPLYVSALAVDTTGNPDAPLVRGTFNAVILATMHNTIYVYDADKENRGPDGRTTPLWARWLGPPRPGGKDIDMWSTNDPEWGILSTPVISDDKRTLFVVAWHDDGPQGLRFRLHALDLQKGTERHPAVQVGPSSVDQPTPCRGQSPFNPCTHKQRAALLLSKGVVYVGFGGDGNRGVLFAFDAQTLAQRAVWSPTPTGENGGIWQSGQGPAADADGNVYLMIGNGTVDSNTPGGRNFGNSFVKLALEAQGVVVKDFFTPCNFGFLNNLDLDVGSGGPVIIPGTPARIVGGGKQGVLYVLSAANLGKFPPGGGGADCQNTNIVQQVAAFAPLHNGETHYGNIHGSPVFWKGPDTSRIYAMGENSELKAFLYAQGRFQQVDQAKKSAFRPPVGMPGGMLALSANGSKAGTGIVWALAPLDGDANQQRGVKAILLALDAQDVSRTLWTSELFMQRDRVGLFAKFNPPVVANGKVFVPTYGDDEPLQRYPQNAPGPKQFPKNYYVAVYGLRTVPPAPRTIVNQDRDDVTVVRAGTAPLTIDTARCTALDAGSVDCTDAVAQAGGAPSFHKAVFARNQDVSQCALLRVVTASKTAAIGNSSGIGFWSAEAAEGNQAPEDSGRFVGVNLLKNVGTATLLNGEAATLHEFVGVANCSNALTRLFKPYMQFEGAADAKVFRNWDLAANYRISRAVPAFDRSQDVVRK